MSGDHETRPEDAFAADRRTAAVRTVLRRCDEMIELARLSGLGPLVTRLERVAREAEALLAREDDGETA